MNRERWLRINEKVQSELNYLETFEAQAGRSFSAAKSLAKTVSESLASKVPAGLEVVVEDRVFQAVASAAPFEVALIAETAVKDALADSVGVERAEAIAELSTRWIVPELAADLMGGQIVSRSVSYADAMWGTFVNNETHREKDEGVTLGRRICLDDPASCEECPLAASDEFIPLDEVAPIGSLQCFGNCRCEIEYDVSHAQT
jgi:hypothetical protein